MRNTDYWNQLIAKSASRFFFLASLARRPMHGYELAREITDCCNGCCTPTDAMIYPAIKEMTAAGLITCTEEVSGGRKRKVCELTDSGWQAYRTAAKAWANALPGITNAVAGALDDKTFHGDEHDQAQSGNDSNCC